MPLGAKRDQRAIIQIKEATRNSKQRTHQYSKCVFCLFSLLHLYCKTGRISSTRRKTVIPQWKIVFLVEKRGKVERTWSTDMQIYWSLTIPLPGVGQKNHNLVDYKEKAAPYSFRIDLPIALHSVSGLLLLVVKYFRKVLLRLEEDKQRKQQKGNVKYKSLGARDFWTSSMTSEVKQR